MKIVVITSSVHANGSSDYLASQFIKGAQIKNNEIYHYNAVDHQNNFVKVNKENNPVVQHDDIDYLLHKIKAADLLVMVTPLYYLGMSALLKIIVDRFYDYNHYLKDDKFTIMMATAAGEDFSSLKLHYHQIIDYMRWKDVGTIWDAGALTHPLIDKYGQEAYKLGTRVNSICIKKKKA